MGIEHDSKLSPAQIDHIVLGLNLGLLSWPGPTRLNSMGGNMVSSSLVYSCWSYFSIHSVLEFSQSQFASQLFIVVIGIKLGLIYNQILLAVNSFQSLVKLGNFHVKTYIVIYIIGHYSKYLQITKFMSWFNYVISYLN